MHVVNLEVSAVLPTNSFIHSSIFLEMSTTGCTSLFGDIYITYFIEVCKDTLVWTFSSLVQTSFRFGNLMHNIAFVYLAIRILPQLLHYISRLLRGLIVRKKNVLHSSAVKYRIPANQFIKECPSVFLKEFNY